MARAIKTVEAAPQVINPEKIVRGLTTVFQGFSIMFDGLSEQLSLIQGLTDQMVVPTETVAESRKVEPKKTSKNKESEKKPDAESEAAADAAEEELPWDDTPQDSPAAADTKASDAKADTAASEEKTAVTITQDDITKVIVAKIKQNRKNNELIGKLLSSYGVRLLSDLPPEKYEAFLNDISQL